MFPVLKYDLRFRTPFGALCLGPTGSGKTQFMVNLLRNKSTLFDHPPTRIVFAYSQWQDAYDQMLANDGSIEFTKNFSDVLENENFFDKSLSNLLILDDLSSVIANNKAASDLFTRGVHHKGVSCIHICQNAFQQGRSMRNLHLNAHYYIIFKNVRDIQQISLLAKQIGIKHLSAAYSKVTSLPYQPVLLDMRTDCPDYLRVRSHIMPEDENIRIYISDTDSSVPEECLRK